MIFTLPRVLLFLAVVIVCLTLRVISYVASWMT